ncbi:hypothetical protein Tco_0653349 [Tanacetum coccineum]|uniref:Uncharacterized protein n=1 Tax=Tanacetum coccineum TaxID=301880 RepID=A0ABQ4X0L8_9ASTR
MKMVRGCNESMRERWAVYSEECRVGGAVASVESKQECGTLAVTSAWGGGTRRSYIFHTKDDLQYTRGPVKPEGFLVFLIGCGGNQIMVVIVAVILVVVVIVIVRVVIIVMFIGIVVVVGVSSIFKPSFVIIGNPLMKTSISFSAFGIMFGQKAANSWNLLNDRALSVKVPVANVTLFTSAQLLRENTDSVRSNQRMRSSSNVVKEEDGEQIRFLGGSSSSGTKKYQGSNSSDGGNTGDGVKITGGVIGSGDGIEFSEELKELLPDEAGK